MWQAVIVQWLMPETTKAVQQSDDGERCHPLLAAVPSSLNAATHCWLLSGVPKELLCKSQGSVVIDVSQPVLVPVNHFQVLLIDPPVC